MIPKDVGSLPDTFKQVVELQGGIAHKKYRRPAPPTSAISISANAGSPQMQQSSIPVRRALTSSRCRFAPTPLPNFLPFTINFEPPCSQKIRSRGEEGSSGDSVPPPHTNPQRAEHMHPSCKLRSPKVSASRARADAALDDGMSRQVGGSQPPSPRLTQWTLTHKQLLYRDGRGARCRGCAIAIHAVPPGHPMRELAPNWRAMASRSIPWTLRGAGKTQRRGAKRVLGRPQGWLSRSPPSLGRFSIVVPRSPGLLAIPDAASVSMLQLAHSNGRAPHPRAGLHTC